MIKPINNQHWDKLGSLKKDLGLVKLLCSKVAEFKPENNEYFTYVELLKHSGLTEDEFYKRCWSLYISIEEDDWDPCIELCALCVVMSDKYHKVWHIQEEEWK